MRQIEGELAPDELSVLTVLANSFLSPFIMNTLSEDVEIIGTISFTQELIFQGRIEGNIDSPSVLTLGETGFVKGDINTLSAVIFGRVLGNLTIKERCEVRSSAVIEGDITAGTFKIEEGATFLGQAKVGKVK